MHLAVNPGGGRLVGLDVLRGFAAVAVMLHHHGQYYDELYPGRAPLSVNFFAGHFGVELFFIISGFVILMTIERKANVWAFAVARAARLMPCFLAALALATVILVISPMPPLDTPTIGRFLANVTMAPLLFGERVVDLPYWTLNYEMVFYLSMGLLLTLGRLRQVEWIALAWIAAGVLFTTLVDVDHHHRTSILLLAYYSNFFVIGMCLYLIQAGRARLMTWVALVAAILTSARGGGEQAFHASGGLYLSLTAAFAFLVWLGTTAVGRWLAVPPLVFLGRISYPLYLVHVVLGFQVIHFGVERGWSTAAGVVAACAVSLVVATLLHYLVEVPGQRWSHRALGERRAFPSLAKSRTGSPQSVDRLDLVD
jgi:peptidoglycan/LPS O-acetylase OafA/YrhL